MKDLTDTQIALVHFAFSGNDASSQEFQKLLSDYSISILDACLHLQHIQHKLEQTLAGFPDEIGD